MSVTKSSRWVGNLSVELTSFVGRRPELAAVRRALSSDRLVTLTGVGGVGKTRLAIRVAMSLRRSFEDGVWLVELADVRDPQLLVQTIAAALDVREQSAAPLATLTEYLGPRRLLLVLDNCEHLLRDCGELCAALLGASPGLRVVVTSREPLTVDGEMVLPVQPLSVPEAGVPSTEALTRYDAVSLFVERAAAAVPTFRLSAQNRAAVVGICRQLDGLPLAIELAATRLRVLSAGQVLERLTDRYRLLTLGMRHAPDRQQSLRASIEWSYELCTAREQLLWVRLGVFAGSFETDAVEGICADGRIPPGQVDDLLASLADKSILVREQYRFGLRYRMLETIREFAVQALAGTGEAAGLHRRHRDWYLGLVETAVEEWINPRQQYWLTRMNLELPQVRAALEFSLGEPGGIGAALRLLVEPWRFFVWAFGLNTEFRRWARRVLDKGGGPPELRSRACTMAGFQAVYQADYTTGQALIAQGRHLAEQSGDPIALSFATFGEGMYATYQADLEQAIARYRTGLTIAAGIPDVAWRLDHLMPLAVDYDLIGAHDEASACHEESLALTEPRGECFHRSYALWALGLARWQSGQPDLATELECASLQLKRAMHERLGVAFCLEALASIATTQGRHERAATLLGTAGTVWRETGSSPSAAQHLAGFHDRCESDLRQILGETVYLAAFARGREMTADEAFAFALGERPTPPAAASAWEQLTRQQQQVAELVAQGLSNRDIAEALFISRRTAEGHVDRILRQLGFTSRTQIPAWLAEQRATQLPDGSAPATRSRRSADAGPAPT